MKLEEFSLEFKKYANIMHINLSDYKIKQFYDYMNMIIEWNEKINLTAIVEPKEMIIKHFIDCIVVNKNIRSNTTVIDVGTGAGFPGIPIKIFDDTLKITLIDSLNKRVLFLQEVISKLNLKNIKVIHGRAEDFAIDINYREKYDYAISRAVAPLNILIEYLAPYVKVKGNVIAMKGSNAHEEIKLATNAIKKLECELIENDRFNLPEDNSERNIIVFKKINKNSKIYPRKAGIPKKNPL